MMLFMYLIVAAVCLSAVRASQAGFSVRYFAHPEHPQVVNADFVSSSQPNSVQIADMYNRLSGFSPLLAEEKEDLPGIDVLSRSSAQPVILEIFGSELPSSVTPVLRSQFKDHHLVRGPSAQEVKEVLQQNGVEAHVAIYMPDAQRGHSLAEWIAEHARTQPVVILHHPTSTTTTSTSSAAQRHLTNTAGDGTDSGSSNSGGSAKNNSDTVAQLTEFQISEYQICLWTGVGFVLLLLASVRTISNMEVIPDSLLYAKFQSGRTGRSD